MAAWPTGGQALAFSALIVGANAAIGVAVGRALRYLAGSAREALRSTRTRRS